MAKSDSKKGNVILDSVIFLVMIVVFGIVGVLGYIAFEDMNDDFQSDSDIGTLAKNETDSLTNRYPSAMDGAFALMFGLLWLTVLVASFMIDSHPVFFIVSIILLIVMLAGAGMIGNTYEEFSADSEFSTAAASFPITTYILEHLLMFVLIIGGTIAIALFGKNRLG